MGQFSRTKWAVLAIGEVLVNVWLALLIPGFLFKGLHALGAHGWVLIWTGRIVLIAVAVVAAAHMVRLVLDQDERSWAWRQMKMRGDRHPDAV